MGQYFRYVCSLIFNLAFAIALLAGGIIDWDNCPFEPKIPVYLLGKLRLNVFMPSKRNAIIECKTNAGFGCTCLALAAIEIPIVVRSRPSPDSKLDSSMAFRFFRNAFYVLQALAQTGWLIAGSVIVYSRTPVYDSATCEPYWFAFGMTTLGHVAIVFWKVVLPVWLCVVDFCFDENGNFDPTYLFTA